MESIYPGIIHSTTFVSYLFNVLCQSTVLPILSDLVSTNNQYRQLEVKHGSTSRHSLRILLRAGLVRKTFDVGNIPIGYEITDEGRRLYHLSQKFESEMKECLKVDKKRKLS